MTAIVAGGGDEVMEPAPLVLVASAPTILLETDSCYSPWYCDLESSVVRISAKEY
jgi:hypothetical protein